MKKQRTWRQFAPVWLIGLLVGMLAGCGTSSTKLGQLQIGMPKAQVIEILGTPHRTTAQGNVEYLGYNLNHTGASERREFDVKLVDGKVDAYGEKADFLGTGRLVPPQTNVPVQAQQTPWSPQIVTQRVAAATSGIPGPLTTTNIMATPPTNAPAGTNAATDAVTSTNAPTGTNVVTGVPTTNAPAGTNVVIGIQGTNAAATNLVVPLIPTATNAPAGTNLPATPPVEPVKPVEPLKPLDGSKPTNQPPAEQPGDPVTPAPDPPKSPTK